MIDDTNFANYPQSVGEMRADKSDEAGDQKPRDVLIRMLRRIDAGDPITDLIVVWSKGRDENGFEQSTPDSRITVGMLASAMIRMHG